MAEETEPRHHDGCEFCDLVEHGSDYLLLSTEFWDVYLADNQNYPGRLIVVLRRHAGSLSDLTHEEWADMERLVPLCEKVLKAEIDVTCMNWTLLMNGGYGTKPYNPHVHLHGIPRYARHVDGLDTPFEDVRFGDHYTLSTAYQLTDEERRRLTEALRERLAEACLSSCGEQTSVA